MAREGAEAGPPCRECPGVGERTTNRKCKALAFVHSCGVFAQPDVLPSLGRGVRSLLTHKVEIFVITMYGISSPCLL